MHPALRLTLALSLFAAPAAFAGNAPHWSYEGHSGPEHWGELEPDFAMCEQGRNQSPIDLQAPVKADLPALSLEYKLDTREILNNGHTVQVNFRSGSTLAVNGREFELKQVHFHTPSENRIKGKSFAAEAHFVHADASGSLAVLAVLFEEGDANAAVAAIEAAVPATAGRQKPFDAGSALAALLPERRDYFEYSGSLTTPPCSEGVLWLVMKQPLSLSRAQLASLSHAVQGPNNRPVQALNARLILN